MSSVHAYKSQVAPFKRYIATAAAQIYNADGTAKISSIPVNTIFEDMGKTVVLADGNVLRKVRRALDFANDEATGYIYLNVDGVSGAQNIAALN